MPSFPPDRFDQVDDQLPRIGVHRVPRSAAHRWFTLLWAGIATALLIIAGLVGLSVIQGGFSIPDLPGLPGSQTPEPTDPGTHPAPAPDPVFDPEVAIRVLNATPVIDREVMVRDALIGAGWRVVTVSVAEETTFETTTVFYSDEAYFAAARGLAEALGGVPVAFSDTYVGLPITVVLGADYDAGGQ